MHRLSTLAISSLLFVLPIPGLAADSLTPIDLSPHVNCRIQTLNGPAPSFPEGPVKFNGIPFVRPSKGLNAWNGRNEPSGRLKRTRKFDIYVGVFGATEVFTLINTLVGEKRPGTFATLEFHGSDGGLFKRTLDGNIDIRDYIFSDYTNSINGTSTVNVFRVGNGLYREVRLDMQRIPLPAEFRLKRLSLSELSMREARNSRLLISGVTVSAVPGSGSNRPNSGPQARSDKLPIPDASSWAAKAPQVREIYEEEFKQARSKSQKVSLAKDLLNQANETEDDAVGRFVLLSMARDLAAENGDVETALLAIQRMYDDFDIDVVVTKSDAFKKLADSVTTTQGREALFVAMSGLIASEVAADRYDSARPLAELAISVVRPPKTAQLLNQATSQLAKIATLEKEYAALGEARDKLRANPAEPNANLAIGKFYCFSKGDWDRGIPMLVLGNDKPLSELASKELSSSSELSAQIELGDGWWNRALDSSGREKENMVALREILVFESTAQRFWANKIPDSQTD